MKLRLAMKIHKAIESGDESRYHNGQKQRALDRIDRTRTAKRQQYFADALMRFLGPEGRADLLARSGRPADAFGVLMRNPEEMWQGDESLIVRTTE